MMYTVDQSTTFDLRVRVDALQKIVNGETKDFTLEEKANSEGGKNKLIVKLSTFEADINDTDDDDCEEIDL